MISDLGTVVQSKRLDDFEPVATIEIFTADKAEKGATEFRAQQWKLTSQGFLMHPASGMVLTASILNKKEVALGKKTTENESDLQKWDLTEASTLQNRYTKHVLAIKGGKKKAGERVWMKKSGKGAAFQWSFA